MAPNANIVIYKFRWGSSDGVRQLRLILLERMAVAGTTVVTIFQLLTMVKVYLSHQPMLVKM